MLNHSKSFIGFRNKNNPEKLSYLPKNYIIGVSERSQRVARNSGSNQIIYVLITGEIYVHKIAYDIEGILHRYRMAIKEIIPEAIITNDYSMDIWRDFYKDDCKALYEKLSKEKNLITEKVDFYHILSTDGRFSGQLKPGDEVIIKDEDKEYKGKIKALLSGSHEDGVMVKLETGEEGRVKKILSEIREPIQYVDSDEFMEDKKIYEQYLKEKEKYDFKEPGLDPRTGQLSKILVIAFIAIVIFGFLKVIFKFI